MPGIENVSEHSRHEFSGAAEVSESLKRTRRRTRIRLATVVVSAALGGSACVAQTTHQSSSQDVKLPRSAQSTTAVRSLGVSKLIYGPAALKDKRHWMIDDEDNLYVPGCRGGTSEEEDPWAGGPEGVAARHDLNYSVNPNRDNERTTSEKGEQVITFVDDAAARQSMMLIRKYASNCGKGFSLKHPAIGNEALSISRVDRSGGSSAQTQNAVVVRQGKGIGIYWDLRNSGAPLATIAKHERDARTMAQRLCGRATDVEKALNALDMEILSQAMLEWTSVQSSSSSASSGSRTSRRPGRAAAVAAGPRAPRRRVVDRRVRRG